MRRVPFWDIFLLLKDFLGFGSQVVNINCSLRLGRLDIEFLTCYYVVEVVVWVMGSDTEFSIIARGINLLL